MSDEIERLLAEEEMSDDDVLRNALVRLRDETTSERPVPSAELSRLLVARAPSVLRRHRGTLTALIVIGAVGAGVTAAAASPAVRSGVQHVFEIVTGTGQGSPVPPAITTIAPSAAPPQTSAPERATPQQGAPSPHPSSGHGAPTAHPTTGVGNGAPKPTPPVGHPTPGANDHSAAPSPGRSQEHRP